MTATDDTHTVLGTCHHDCPDSCGWVVTVSDGVAVSLKGNPAHPYSQGELCPKVNRFLDRVYSPDRVLHPLRRVGPKGSGQFEQVSWDEALGIIAERLHAVIDEYGGEAVMPWSDAGNQSMLALAALSNRVFDRIGATHMTGAVCGLAARVGVAATYGSGRTMDPLDLKHSNFIVLWGTNTRMTNRHLWPTILEARSRGAQIVVIDPIRTMTAESADWFVQPLPGTDTALALGMMHVIVRDGLTDDEYLRDHTVGFDELRQEVATWTPERTAQVCGLEADEVERLARAYATTSPAAIRMLIGAEHHENGAMIYRTVACLPLLTGAWRHLGGGLARSSGSWFDVAVDDVALAGPPLGVSERRGINQSLLGRALAGEFEGPPVAALVVWNGNPLVTLPNTELTRQGLMREDLFTVVHEQFLTDTARHADIVLPATTQIEQRDVVPAWGHLHLGWNEAAIAPLGESVSNTEMFRRIARAMGYTEPELFVSDDDLIAAALHRLDDETLATLEADGFIRIALPDPLLPYAHGGFDTPSGKALLRNDGLAALGMPTVPAFVPPVESPTGDPELFGRYPLVMLTTKSHNRFLNSSYSHLPKHGPLEGVPMLDIHATDAAARGIADGDRVRVHNDRGSLELVARLSERVRPGLVTVPFGWWMHQHDDGNVANSLTNDTLTDFGGGVAYHDNLVEVSAI